MHCLTASLASTHQIPVTPPPKLYQPKISLCISKCPWEKLSQLNVLVSQLCTTLCDPMDCGFCLWNSPGKNAGVDSHSLLQGRIPTQGLHSHLLHWHLDSLPSEPPGSPFKYISIRNKRPQNSLSFKLAVL